MDSELPACRTLVSHCEKVCEATELFSQTVLIENRPLNRCDKAEEDVTCRLNENTAVFSPAYNASCGGRCPTQECTPDDIEWEEVEVNEDEGGRTVDLPVQESLEQCTVLTDPRCGWESPKGCRPGIASCLEEDEPCQTSVACCSKNCDPESKRCTECREIDEGCTLDMECCSENCDPNSNRCVVNSADQMMLSSPAKSSAPGLLSGLLLPKSEGRLTESARVGIEIDDDVFSVPVTGRFTLGGHSCPGYSCSLNIEFHIYALSSFSTHGIEFENFRVSAFTRTPILIDETGAGVIAPGEMEATVAGLVEGRFGGRAALSVAPIFVNINWEENFIEFVDGFEVVPGVIVRIDLQGEIQNQPPMAQVDDREKVVECTSPDGTEVALDASSSWDADDNIVSTTWYEGKPFIGDLFSREAVTSQTAPFGTTRYFVKVQDAFGQMGFNSTQVTVEDTTPPVFEEPFPKVCFWPPNHDYVILESGKDFGPLVQDACDANPDIFLTGGSSSQPDNDIADGNFDDDIVVFPTHICVRVERQGNDPAGREYTVEVLAEDFSGNSSQAAVALHIPHDRRPDDCIWVDQPDETAKEDPRCDPELAKEAMDEFWAERTVSEPAGSRGGCSLLADPSTNNGGLINFLLLLSMMLFIRTRRNK